MVEKWEEQHLLEASALIRSLPQALMLVIIGGIVLGTLAISRFSLKIRVPAIPWVPLLGVIITPSFTLFSNAAIERLQVLSLLILLFKEGLETEIRSIRDVLDAGIILAFVLPEAIPRLRGLDAAQGSPSPR